MSTKKKILLIIAAFLIGFLLIILLTILTSLDISTEELGPSPFKIKEDLTLDENQEFHELVKFGESIKGAEEFEKNYSYSEKELQLSISTLQKYLEQNEGLIEKAHLDLFKKCIFPKPKDAINPSMSSLVELLRLINRRATFHILSNNFDKAKSNLIFINEINNELIKKTTHYLSSNDILYSKKMEISNIKLLINLLQFSLEQKLDILGISHEPINTSQLLTNNLYFDSTLLQQSLIDICSSNVDRPKRLMGFPDIPILNNYLYKPNKSIRYYRKKALLAISLLETSSFKTINDFRDRDRRLYGYLHLIRANSFGQYLAEISIYRLKNEACNALSINNSYNQLYVAQQILLYKQKSNQLPPDLNVLNLDKKKSIDLQNGAPFLYFSPNGILYGLGYYENFRQPRLSNEELPEEEIMRIIKENHDGREFILYLK